MGNTFLDWYSPRGEWADPGGTAIPGQPVEKSEQAPASSASSKNQFNIEVPYVRPSNPGDLLLAISLMAATHSSFVIGPSND